MALFQIRSAAGVIKYTGAPVFTESYLKVGVLEFREISSPVPINWAIGDYVQYSRTGLKYSLYSFPVQTVRKQAGRGTYGAAFVYTGVQFFAPAKQLEITPFRDLVRGDNRIHFSTQNSIAVWDDVYGIAERINATMNDMYSNQWRVQVLNTSDASLLETFNTELEYSVQGVSCLGALDKIYELWGVGWTYSQVYNKNVITIGGADERTSSNTAPRLSYGKGYGLVTLERSISGKDEMATRLYVYGSSSNMVSRYYNNLDLPIKEKASIDIRHLMLPVQAQDDLDWEGWGKTNGQYDASKSYIQDDEAVSKYGLVIKSVYFDGTDNEDIHPTLKGITIADVRSYLPESSQFYPSTEIYTDGTERIDLIKSATNPSDHGVAGSNGGKYVVQEDVAIPGRSEYIPLSSGRNLFAVASIDGFEGESGELFLSPNVTFYLECPEDYGDALSVYLMVTDANGRTESTPLELTGAESVTGYRYELSLPEMSLPKGFAPYRISMTLDIRSAGLSGNALLQMWAGNVVAGLETTRVQTSTVTLKQIGFDIKERAALGEGKATVIMTSGMCNGRSFLVKACDYLPETDSWKLTLWRQRDSSTDMWYPNADYPINADDSFVLTDIAMPEIYIRAAERRLLVAGRKLLSELSTPSPVFTPKVDAKYIREYQDIHNTEKSPMRSGTFLRVADADVENFGYEYALIDTVTINEGESNIPTYSLTLRERKKVIIKESVAASSMDMSSSVVDSSAVESTGQTTGTITAKSYNLPSGIVEYSTDAVFRTPNLVSSLYDGANNYIPADTQILKSGNEYYVKVTFDETTTQPFRLVVIGY